MPGVDAVNVEVHVAEAVVPARVHGVNESVTPVSLRLTVPVGVVAPVEEVSVTVTVHVEPSLVATGVEQVTPVVVGSGVAAVTIIGWVVLVELAPRLSCTIREAVNVVVVVTV